MVFAAGVEMLWVAAPPSDQETKVKVLPPEVCGDTTPSARMIPTTPVTESGVRHGLPVQGHLQAGRVGGRVMVDVRGRTSRKIVVVSPAGSRTVRWIRNQTFAEISPCVGTVNEPLVMPVVAGMNGWKCVSWWKSTRQVKALAGSAPFSGSFAGAGEVDGLSAGVERARGGGGDGGGGRHVCS